MENRHLFEVLFQSAMLLYDEAGVRPPEWYAMQLMDTQGLPMHCPEHHFIVPAALLLAAHRRAGTARDKVKQDLHTAMVRGQTIPGGFCGNCGCCGAAVGAGMFLSIWLATNPKSTENWALIQRMTARALEEIAVVEGPRCCKRVTFFALEAARILCKTECVLDLGDKQEIVCLYYSNNQECRHTACPYFPRRVHVEGNMTDFYLITGFLGAGKTSLLKSLLPQFAGQKVRLIINEFGKAGLDGALLREQGAQISEIVNGSIFCVCRLDQFESAIDEAMADAPDVIFVETSGLSDPSSIRAVLANDERAKRLRYRGAICLVDAPRFRKIITTARSCKKQLAVADLVLINKCDMVGEEECVLVEQLLHSICLADNARTTYGTITREQLERLSPSDHAVELDHRPDLTLQKESLMISPASTSKQVIQMLMLIAEDTYRIKGFLSVSDGNFLVDCVGTDVRVTPYSGSLEKENRLTLLAGEGMPLRKSVRFMLQQYGELASRDRNDKDD